MTEKEFKASLDGLQAYHFTDGYRLRDGQLLEVGREYVFDGEPVMCVRGYHASRNVFDALKYAPGPILSWVECKEITEERDDKLVCRRRRVIATIDATELLRRFARLCALDVIHLWDAPDVVVRYLKTGDESIRDAAMAAAWDARSDANAAARSDANVAARNAAKPDARIAARSAAWASASAIGRDTARQGQRVRLDHMVNQAFNSQFDREGMLD